MRLASPRRLLRSLLRACLAAVGAALCLVLAAPVSRADPRQPSDVLVAPRAEGDALELPPLPRGFVREQRGPVVWIRPRAEAERVAALEQVFKRHWASITAELGRDVDPSMTIALARDLREMRAIAPVGHPPPRYAVGVAYPAAGIVLLSLEGPGFGSRPDVETVLVHELSHVALARAIDAHPVPRWFSEGLAIMQAGEQRLARTQTLFEAFVDGDLPPLGRLDRAFSGRAFEVDVAYAVSADVVAYLSRVENGGRKLRRLIAGLRRGEPFARALEKSHYVSVRGLDREWRANLRERYGNLPFVVGGGALWAVATVLLLLAWRKRRLEKRRQLRRMEHEELALERIEALLAAKLDQRSPAAALPEAQGDEEERSPSDVPPPNRDEEVPTVVHQGRSHTLH